MKKLKIIAVAFLLANSFWGCEKDDICADGTPTTPEVVIEFYDALDPTTLKPVTNLRIFSEGLANVPASGSKIKIPLNTNGTETSFKFVKNGLDEDTANDNTDVLTFNYATSEIFISRACGFKSVFQLTEDNPVLTDGDASLWISSVEVIQSNIQNEDETHIKIYF